ncbi:MAG: MASE2 domain-containing protein [Rudaea sp.]|nr:MASE2 domain-containing protein [Rudaea sp.]
MLLSTPFAISADRDSPVRQFVERSYRMRLFGLSLGLVCIASVLYQNAAHVAVWALLIANACVWPPLARFLALRSVDPVTTETRSLLIDSAMGGVWIALMQFNLLPSVLIALVLSIDKIRIDGWLLLMRSLVVQLAACVLAAAIHGLEFAPQTTMLTIVASLPLLIGYPLAMSVSAHSLMQTVRYQNHRLARLHRENPVEVLDSAQ